MFCKKYFLPIWKTTKSSIPCTNKKTTSVYKDSIKLQQSGKITSLRIHSKINQSLKTRTIKIT